MQVHELKCFGATPGNGNPALVIEGGPLGAADRQELSRSRNTTCVFIDACTEPDVALTTRSTRAATGRTEAE